MNTDGKKGVFLDRDGTLIEDRHYLKRVDEVCFIDGAIQSLRDLSDLGFDLFLVTNQSGVGRGYFTLEDVEVVHVFISKELESVQIRFAEIYVAPEAPGEPSYGRKPSPQFLLDAAIDFGIDLGQSYMIGDKMADLECGWNAGVRESILVRTGHGVDAERELAAVSHRPCVVNTIVECVSWIKNNDHQDK
jgi:D-glycero-D-manno-heptose 1,7-bisphosphate phosphatase